MEDLNARTESVIGDSADENDEQAEVKTDEKIVIGNPEVDDEPEELKEEQAEAEEPELPLEPDDPE